MVGQQQNLYIVLFVQMIKYIMYIYDIYLQYLPAAENQR